MRRGFVVAVAGLCCFVLAGSAARADLVPWKILVSFTPAPTPSWPVGKENIFIRFSGQATEQDTVYSAGSSAPVRHQSTLFKFSGSCHFLADVSRVRPGFGALCDAGHAKDSSGHDYLPSVSGAVTYTSFNDVTGAAEGCFGTVNWRKGASWWIGGTVDRGNRLRAESSAPTALTAVPEANQIAVTSNNPNLGCTGLTLENAPGNSAAKGDYGLFRVNRTMPFPTQGGAAVGHNRWSAPFSSGLQSGTVTFDGTLYIDVYRGPKGQAKSGTSALMSGVQQGWNDALNGSPASGAFNPDLTSGGRIQARWSRAGSVTHAPLLRANGTRSSDSNVLFTIDQSLHAGLNTLNPQLTPLGQAVLAGSESAPNLDATVTFTPTNGAPVTVTGTFAPTVLPVVTSVQFTGSQKDPTIIIRGRGLAPLPAQDPVGSPAGHNGCPPETGQTGADYGVQLEINDLLKNWGAGFSIPTATSCIGLIPTKVTPGELDLRLGSFYKQYYPKFTLAPGDEVQVVANGAPIDVHVAYGAAVTK
jgi:hypothetical protein